VSWKPLKYRRTILLKAVCSWAAKAPGAAQWCSRVREIDQVFQEQDPDGTPSAVLDGRPVDPETLYDPDGAVSASYPRALAFARSNSSSVSAPRSLRSASLWRSSAVPPEFGPHVN